MTKRNDGGSLGWRATKNTVIVLVVAAIALIASAGTLTYWQGWTYVALHGVSMVSINAYLLRHDRPLLERRLAVLDAGEAQGVQKLFFALIRPLGLVIMIVAGLDRRFGWSAVPLSVFAAGSVMFVLGNFIIYRVFRENTFASSVIEVGQEQHVVSTGPYRFVRHPLYSGMLLGIVASPLVLGSFWAEAAVPLAFALFVVRLLAEERYLSGSLPGYHTYLAKTRRRLIPGLWLVKAWDARAETR